MPAVDYSRVVKSLVYVLATDARLEEADVTEEGDPPTMEQCAAGAVRVDITGFSREPKRLCAVMREASPYNESVYFRLRCWVFDAQGTGPARRRREVLVQTVMDVVMDHYTLNDTVLIAGVHRGDFQPITKDGGGIFACAELSLEALVNS